MSLRLTLFLSVLCWFLTGCIDTPEKPDDGEYLLLFQSAGEPIPIRMRAETHRIGFRNADEWVYSEEMTRVGDSVFYSLPYYDSEINLIYRGDSVFGRWLNHHKTNYSVPFAGVKNTFPERKVTNRNRRYLISFGDVDTSAVGIFSFGPGYAEGTFLTESGDYRFLEGEISGNKLYLSCFDGAHLFFFSAEMAPDSSLRNGVFLSGNHYSQTWRGQPDKKIELRDPDALTTWTNPGEPLSFKAENLSGQTISVSGDFFSGYITAVALVGSWCPNCTDLENFLIPKQSHPRFRFLPVCFESSTDSLRLRKQLLRHFEGLGHGGEILLGGSAKKAEAENLFRGLSGVTAFPTTLLVDQNGLVRHIHTGFYGPGTGDYHLYYTGKLDEIIESLLGELSIAD